jgi:hypothetical protein
VLHATRESYRRAVGRDGSQTVGSTTVWLSAGRATKRRIDLLATDRRQCLAPLPHELIHVLFADASPTTPPPKWAEEGLALLMDSPAKRARHASELVAAFRARSTLPLERLLLDVDYPGASQRTVFYAQSLSLVEYLTQVDSRDKFFRFVKLSTELGHHHALQAVYRLDERELNRRWHQFAAGTQLAGTPAM